MTTTRDTDHGLAHQVHRVLAIATIAVMDPAIPDHRIVKNIATESDTTKGNRHQAVVM